MPQQTAPFVEAKYGWNLGESGWNSGMDENLLKFSFMFDRNIDGIVSALPTATNGSAYFLTTDKRLYFAVNNLWYSTPVPKWFVFTLRTTGQTYQYDGVNPVQVKTSIALQSDVTAIQATLSGYGTAAQQNTEYFTAKSDITNATDTDKGAGLVGYKSRTVAAKLAETPSVSDYPSITAAENAVAVSGGTLKYPAGTYGSDTVQTVGNVVREYFGPNSIGNSYTTTDTAAVAARLFRYSDATNHIGKEGYTVFVESRPKGSTDGSVPGSDFGLGVSIIKQNWTNSVVEGQVCGLNTVTRGGYFNQPRSIVSISQSNPAVVTTATPHGYSNGDVVIIQNAIGMFQVNIAGKFTVSGVTGTTFQLSGINSTSYNAYTGSGIVQKDSGIVNFYNPADTATYIANTVQSSANGFSAQFEGASYYTPSGQFIAGLRGIRVQLGAIKHSEDIGIGVLAVSTNGANGAAFQAQNSRADVGMEGVWTKAFSYITNFGPGAYEAFQINQLGQIVLHGGTSATTPKKTIRNGSTNGQLEVVNDAGTAVIMNLLDSGTMSIRGNYQILGTQVVGPRDTGWATWSGTANKSTSYATSTITLPQLAERVNALQIALTTHGMLG